MESLAELLATGRIKEAGDQARRRLAQNPGDPEALLAMTKVALVEGRLGESEALLARVASKAPPDDVTLLRAALACQKEEWTVARDHYASLTRRPKPLAEAWYGLGVVQATLGELPAACASLEKAVAADPRQASFRLELGRTLTLNGQLRQATFHLTRGLRLSPEDERGYRVLAYILLKRGHPLQARRVLERGLRHAPTSHLLREGLAGLPDTRPEGGKTNEKEQALIHQVNELMKRSRNREALKQLRAASEQGLRTVSLKLLEADACEALLPADLEGATRAYEEAIALEPDNWVGYSNMGLFVLRQGGLRGVTRAIQVLEEARRRAPTRPEPALNLALAYSRGGRHAEALALATQLVQGLPEQHPLAAQARRLVDSQGR